MVCTFNEWCRLCAKEDGAQIDIFSTNLNNFELKELITKYFTISLNHEDETPKKICINCYKFIEQLIAFTDTVKKVDLMYLEILSKVTHDNDIREEYGIKESIKSELIDTLHFDEYEKVLPSEDVTISIKQENFNEEMTELDEEVVETEETKNSLINISEIKSNKKNQHKKKVSTSNNSKVNNNDNIEGSTKEKVKVKKQIITATSGNKKINKIKVRKEKRIKIEERVQCHVCNKTFSTKHFLKEHITTQHTEPQFECTVCHKKFGTERRLKIHGDAHLPYEQRYACPFCDKKFTKSVNIKPHIRAVHLGEKSFVCEECGKAFATKGNLMGHMYTHNTEIIYKCSHCVKEFRNKHCLQVHEDTHSDTVYICPQCGLQLKTRRTLNTHMLVHSDEKKYKCEHCGMAFKRSGHLKRHLISHIGLKPFSCQFCDKAFTNTQNCRMHMNKVHSHEIAGLESIGSGITKITNDAPTLDQLKTIAAQAPLSQFQNDMNKVHSNEIAGLESIGSGITKITNNAPTLDQLKTIAAQVPLPQFQNDIKDNL